MGVFPVCRFLASMWRKQDLCGKENTTSPTFRGDLVGSSEPLKGCSGKLPGFSAHPQAIQSHGLHQLHRSAQESEYLLPKYL